MRKYNKFLAFVLVFLTMVCFCGCGAKHDRASIDNTIDEAVNSLVGDWAYIHDPAESILLLTKDGKAVYNGVDYKYTIDENYIVLDKGLFKDKIRLRYSENSGGFILYQSTEYTYKGNGTPDSIIGEWVNEPNRWYYEFTDSNSFNEDGFFQGYYTLDAQAKTIKLAYNDHFEDAILYYSLEGNVLTIDYPWQMVKAEK